MSQIRSDRAFHLAVVEGVPVDGSEEGMGLDAVDAAGKVAEALGRVDRAKAGDEGAGVGVDVGGKFDFACADPGGGYERWA